MYATGASSALFERCQNVVNSYGKKRTTIYKVQKPYALRGIISCGCCGRTITPDFKKKDRYIYLRCNKAKRGGCDNKTEVDGKKMLLQAEGFVDKIVIPQKSYTLAMRSLQKQKKMNPRNWQGVNK